MQLLINLDRSPSVIVTEGNFGVAHVRAEVKPSGITVAMRRDVEDVETDGELGDLALDLELRLGDPPTCTLNQEDHGWSLYGGVPIAMSWRADVFVAAARWLANANRSTSWTDARRFLAWLPQRAVAMTHPIDRRIAMRFSPWARWDVYALLRGEPDPTRVRQVAAVAPGLLPFWVALRRVGCRLEAAEIIDGVRRGDRLNRIIDRAVARWAELAEVRHRCGQLGDADARAALLRQRALIRNAPAGIKPRLVLTPAPRDLVQSDFPTTDGPEARAWWVMMEALANPRWASANPQLRAASRYISRPRHAEQIWREFHRGDRLEGLERLEAFVGWLARRGPPPRTARVDAIFEEYRCERRLRARVRISGETPLPLPAPWPASYRDGGTTFVALTKVVELHKEGVRQRHCVFSSCLRDSLSGNAVVFGVVTGRARLTLAVRRRGQAWQYELRGRGNLTPNSDEVLAVERFLTSVGATVVDGQGRRVDADTAARSPDGVPF